MLPRFKNLINHFLLLPLLLSVISIVSNAVRFFLGYTNSIFIHIQTISFTIIIVIIVLYPMYLFFIKKSRNGKFRLKEFCLALSLLIYYLYLLSYLCAYSILLLFITMTSFHIASSYILKAEINTSFKKKTMNYLRVIPILALIITTSFSYLMFELSMRSLNNVEAVGEYVFTRNYYYNGKRDAYLSLHRSGSDIYKWILFGIGQCGEAAYVSQYILEKIGYEAYVAGFPGEDHMFTIVKLNNSWYVVDPGYYGGRILRLEDRVRDRIKEYGNISSIVAYITKRDIIGSIKFEGFIDLTCDYVPHDIFVICVTCREQPVPNAKVILKHKFHGVEVEIPLSKLGYYTNASGCAVVCLGGSEYARPEAEPYDKFFQIYINNKPTNMTIISSLQGRVFVIKIDICIGK